MKNKLFFLILKVGIAGLLLIGGFLIWASFQSFETLASLLNQLASDGQLESFTPSIYKAIKLPLGLVGIFLVIAAGLVLFRWDKVKAWLQGLPHQVRRFLNLLRQDTKDFFEDARMAIKNLQPGGIAALIGLMLVALVMRLVNLDLPLSHDEAYTYNSFASRSLWHIVSDYHLPNNHVFLSILIHFTTGLLGSHIWAIRLPTILAGMVMVPAAFWLGKRLYNTETAFLGAALVAVFPVLIKYAVFARGYTIICLFTLLLLSLGDTVRVKQNRFAWLLIIILSALGFSTLPIMLFPFGGLYVWLFGSWLLGDTRSYESKASFLKYWLVSGFSAAFITVVLYLPIMVNNADRFFGNGFIAPVPWDIFPETLLTRLRNTWLEWIEAVPLWIVALGVFGFIMALILHRRLSKQKIPMQLAIVVWIIVLLVARRPDMLPRFWLFLAAPVVIWAAAGIVGLLQMMPLEVGKKWSLAQTFVALVFALVAVQSLVLLPAIPSRWRSNDGMAQATLFLKDRVREGDMVTATSARLPALRYYFNYFGLPKGYIRQSGEFQRVFIIIDEKKVETLETIAPQLGFGLPAIDMGSIELVYQQGDFTIYEAYPAP